MTVYVDWIQPCKPTDRWPWNKSCHLFADTVDELNQFAARLELKREWFQGKRGFPHYDLTEGKRKKAVRLGAKEIGSKKEWIALVQRLRPGWFREGY